MEAPAEKKRRGPPGRFSAQRVLSWQEGRARAGWEDPDQDPAAAVAAAAAHLQSLAAQHTAAAPAVPTPPRQG